jgi:5'-methylthioadenosine phosphorylase
VPDQFFDRTRGRSARSSATGSSAHVGFAHPFCKPLSDVLIERGQAAARRAHRAAPTCAWKGRSSRPWPSRTLYRASGFDIIGMTNLQEAKLAREAEICYTTLALVTDYDCWHPDHDSVTVE